MRGLAKKINWLWAAGGFTLVYLVGAALIVGLFRAWSFVTTGDLNEVGDFLAGVFSPLAVIWLVAAVLTQRQELDETREQFAASQAVIDGQMRNIAAQNLTSALQYEKAQEAAKQTYKLNLFDKRFDIYNRMLAIRSQVVISGISYETWEALRRTTDEMAFVYSYEIENQFIKLNNVMIDYLQLIDTIRVEDDYGNMVPSLADEHQPTRDRSQR